MSHDEYLRSLFDDVASTVGALPPDIVTVMVSDVPWITQ